MPRKEFILCPQYLDFGLDVGLWAETNEVFKLVYADLYPQPCIAWELLMLTHEAIDIAVASTWGSARRFSCRWPADAHLLDGEELGCV